MIKIAVIIDSSGGISSYPETSLLENLITDADNFLYRAKLEGKNRILSTLTE